LVTLSIVVPCFNASEWLPGCISSVLLQDYTNFELILVDDGSIDNTLKLCLEFSDLDNRVIVLHQQNQGVVSARHNGFVNSIGKIIMFLDSDDRLKANALSVIVHFYELSGCDLLRFGFDFCHSDWMPFASVLPPVEGLLLNTKVLACFDMSLKTYSSPSIWDKAYSRDLVGQVFDRVKDIQISHSEDMLFSLYALALSSKTYFLKLSLYLYLQRVGSAIHSRNSTALLDKSQYLDALLGLYVVVHDHFHKRIDVLIKEEASESVSYLINNAVAYSTSVSEIYEEILAMCSSKWYCNYVQFKKLSLKRLLRDSLLTFPYAFVIFLLIKRRLSPRTT